MFDVYTSCRRVDSGGVSLNVADHGPPDGEPVLMLHGFPDSARLWRNQIPALVEAGYRVIAPDLRGFGRSDLSVTARQCGMRAMVGDVITVLSDAGVESAHVVGHDWGAAISWAAALSVPDRVRSLTALSVGHPSAFQAAGLAQREKSWYMLLFQFEGLAEKWLSDNDW
ncbi:MAG TPA: alpha/beta fold hydrolase, partial [Acidimicrobiia bacterium]|nr:alpha/beta fold hydrolase [Acidimicrobiia bacterium]